MTGPTTFPPAVRDAVLAWYATNGRTLPFRGTTDPYAILVSEAMAQQTQVTRAGAAWTAFMARFPTVEALAAAVPADVLRAWRGLGYNRRALDLWRAAGRIVEAFDGTMPSNIPDLESLPGVGPYTARAVAAIAFGMPVGAVDTNVRRVLGRMVSGDPAALPPAALQRLADHAVPPDRPGEWTHALMDLGAMVCHPRGPDCAECPARAWCRYADASAARLAGPRAAVAPQAVRRPGTRERPGPFRTTSRWLRGRIMDRLREASNGEWIVIDGSVGEHDHAAVLVAAQALAAEGLLEIDGTPPEGTRARLPIS